MTEKTVDEWNRCYPSNWKGLIVEGAFAHPAKFSNKLIRKIYDHILAEGWVQPGDMIVDPFGGVGLGALDAMRLGLRWRGSELEERFVKLGNENIQFWNNKFGRMPKWSGDAVLLQGDSRLLSQVLCQAHRAVNLPPYKTGGGHKHQVDTDCDFPQANLSGRRYISGYGAGDDLGASAAVSSPPFSDVLARDNVSASDRRSLADEKGIANTAKISPIDLEKVGKRTQGSYGGLDTSPPYVDSLESNNGIDMEKLGQHGPNTQAGQDTKYGAGPAQLGAMKATQKGLQMAVTSPPFGKQNDGQGIAASMRGNSEYELTNPALERTKKAANAVKGIGYSSQGDSNGQLGSMKTTADGFQVSVTSPPFLQSEGGHPEAKEGGAINKALYDRHNAGNKDGAYGETNGQLSADSYDDFWISARAIVEQVFMVLEPGAHAVWVLKDYVKNKERVPFCTQWQQMCEAVGFATLHEHHALLVRHKGISTTDMDGKVVSHEVSSKSFFRRLAEKKGSPKIDFETVLCMIKPV